MLSEKFIKLLGLYIDNFLSLRQENKINTDDFEYAISLLRDLLKEYD